MPINGFWVKNYKAFADKTEIKIRPLTLLFGYNSAGKSALLRVLPLLADSVRSSNTGEPAPIALDSEAARGATFEDLQCQLTDHPAISFGLSWKSGTVTGVELVIRNIPELKRQIVEEMRIVRRQKEPVYVDWVLPSSSKGNFPLNLYRVSARELNGLEGDVRFRGLIPDLSKARLAPSIKTDLTRAETFLTHYLTRVLWLRALRSLPPRYDTFSNVPPRIESDGRGAARYLAYDFSNGGKVLDEVSNWYQRATGHSMSVNVGSFNGKALFSLNLHPHSSKDSQRSIELVDTGEGMGQVLPVVTLLSMVKHKKLRSAHTLLFEHPELHLHPAAHAPLASYFCEVASMANSAPLIVETHSENFMLRIQLEIAEGRLNSDSVLVYWVHQTQQGEAQVSEISFDEFGQPVGDRWPPGLFSENIEQSRKIILARRRRREV